jgi:hypothetical protein
MGSKQRSQVGAQHAADNGQQARSTSSQQAQSKDGNWTIAGKGKIEGRKREFKQGAQTKARIADEIAWRTCAGVMPDFKNVVTSFSTFAASVRFRNDVPAQRAQRMNELASSNQLANNWKGTTDTASSAQNVSAGD